MYICMCTKFLIELIDTDNRLYICDINYKQAIINREESVPVYPSISRAISIIQGAASDC